MYRQIFKPINKDSVLAFPSSLYGRNVEVIILPLPDTSEKLQAERRLKREENNSKFSFSTKKFKFNRDEANEYD